VDLLGRIKAQAYSIEAATPRHAYKWRMWEAITLPEGKVLIPSVIAEVDGGCAQRALYQRQHPTVMWAKFGS
jgi:5-methyltetrahydropteroyltriglutamate--homocysteine methyltransferase